MDCGCGDSNCDIWKRIYSAGQDNIYRTIFDLFPGVNTIIDSSKDPTWISDRTNQLLKTGLKVQNIIIWKTPQEFLQSRIKRGKHKAWARAWINYHKMYFRLVEKWISIRYSELVSDPDSLKGLCNALDITYFSGKERYWEKTHHTLFGSTRAKIHLHDEKSERFDKYKTELESRIDMSKSVHTQQRHIYYEMPENNIDDRAFVRNKIVINEIQETLVARNYANKEIDYALIQEPSSRIRANFSLEAYYRAKRHALRLLLK